VSLLLQDVSGGALTFNPIPPSRPPPGGHTPPGVPVQSAWGLDSLLRTQLSGSRLLKVRGAGALADMVDCWFVSTPPLAPLPPAAAYLKTSTSTPPTPATRAQLVPRINPYPSPIPGSDRDRDRQRLLTRLGMYGLCEKEVLGDGNCQVGGSWGLVLGGGDSIACANIPP
jgi:hypothetical protein